MRIERIKDFISETERLEILEWFKNNENNINIFKPAFNRFEDNFEKRLSTRRVKNIELPSVIEKIFLKIKKTFKFTWNCQVEKSEYNNGIIAVITKKDGDTFSHKDTNSNCHENTSVIRFNILIQKSESGGILWVKDENENDIEIETEERELHAYNVSDFYHAVTKVNKQDRYILLFSICCPKDDWEDYKIILNKG